MKAELEGIEFQEYFVNCNKNKFVQCSYAGGCFDMPCPSGLVWNQKREQCDYDDHEKTNLTEWVKHETEKPESGEDVCYECEVSSPCISKMKAELEGIEFQEYFVNCNKNKFVQCSYAGGCFDMPCPSGLVWNQKREQCDYGDNEKM